MKRGGLLVNRSPSVPPELEIFPGAAPRTPFLLSNANRGKAEPAGWFRRRGGFETRPPRAVS